MVLSLHFVGSKTILTVILRSLSLIPRTILAMSSFLPAHLVLHT